MTENTLHVLLSPYFLTPLKKLWTHYLVREAEPQRKHVLSVLTLKQLSKCLPRVSPSPKKVSFYSFLWTPLLPSAHKIWGCYCKKSNSAALKCAVVYCFHIKPWMDGHDIQQCPAESQTVSVLLFFQDVLSAFQYRINIGKFQQFLVSSYDMILKSFLKYTDSTHGSNTRSSTTCCPSASGCRKNRCGHWHICLVSEWSCHLHMEEEEGRSSHSLSGYQPNMLHGDRHTQY